MIRSWKGTWAWFKNSDILGFLFPGDGATISRNPLFNILVSRKNIPVAVLEIIYCQGHLADGGKKDGTFMCNIFIDHMKKIDPNKTITYVVMFDGALSVQLGGELMKIHYSNLTVMHVVENTDSIFLNDYSKISIVNKKITDHNFSCALCLLKNRRVIYFLPNMSNILFLACLAQT